MRNPGSSGIMDRSPASVLKAVHVRSHMHSLVLPQEFVSGQYFGLSFWVR